ncbi:Secreted protein, with PKD repeat domain [Halanaeroarchaeum sp. HSR-CO]|uniref:hypothetical protein n=1 Tax=Halanaeroarchaeum sp. HSR-CO TaxID=2866382 RepID=UPI00217E5D0C|nr:hypothetical protein [Halanaeroarchaeum sp. HSR-CO]UWG48927.1 Secreted protein, with PKD repeat domain [Halanaeroarchaeum sp. HSR-CO]
MRKAALFTTASALGGGFGPRAASASDEPSPAGVDDSYTVIHRDPVYVYNTIDPEVHRVVKGYAKIRLAPSFYGNDWDATWWGSSSALDNYAEENRLSSVGLTSEETAFLTGLTGLNDGTWYNVDLADKTFSYDSTPGLDLEDVTATMVTDPGFEDYTKTVDEQTEETVTYEVNPDEPNDFLEIHEYTIYVTQQDVTYQVIAAVFDERESLIEIAVDVKPGDSIPAINPNSRGVTPVAIHTTGSFDASSVDVSTLCFGDPSRVAPYEDCTGASAVRSSLEDVDSDGDDDLVVHFETRELGLSVDTTTVELVGKTDTGTWFRGTDSVRVVDRGHSGVRRRPPDPTNR